MGKVEITAFFSQTKRLTQYEVAWCLGSFSIILHVDSIFKFVSIRSNTAFDLDIEMDGVITFTKDSIRIFLYKFIGFLRRAQGLSQSQKATNYLGWLFERDGFRVKVSFPNRGYISFSSFQVDLLDQLLPSIIRTLSSSFSAK